MDNSLKLLIGVLSIAGVLAFLAPTSVTPTEAPVEAAPVAAVPVVETPANDQNVDGGVPEEEAEDQGEEEEYFKFGEPTIDGQPFTGGDDSSTENDNSDVQDQSSQNQPAAEISNEVLPPNFKPQNTGQ
jgi:hypothetical protein